LAKTDRDLLFEAIFAIFRKKIANILKTAGRIIVLQGDVS